MMNSPTETSKLNQTESSFNLDKPVEARIEKNCWHALVHYLPVNKDDNKASLIVTQTLEEILKKKSIAYPFRINQVTPLLVEDAIFEAMLVAHYSIVDTNIPRKKDKPISIAIVYIHTDRAGNKTAVIGQDGPHTRVYMFRNGEIFQLTRGDSSNFIGMPIIRKWDLKKGDVSIDYSPTVFSMPVPVDASVFSLSEEVFDLFSKEEITAYINKVGNVDRATRTLVAVASDSRKTPLQKVELIRAWSK